EDSEDAAKERPGGFARLDRARRRFFERRVHKPMPRAHGGEDPRAKAAALAGDLRQREPADPARVDLQLLPQLTVDDRDRGGRPPKLELEDGKPVERRIRDHDALPREE